MNENEKQRLIKEWYGGIEKKNHFFISLKSRIELSTLLQYLRVESKDEDFAFEIYHDEKDQAFYIEILNRLIREKIIIVSPDSSISAFEDADFPKVFYVSKVKYRLNIDIPQGESGNTIFDSLKYPNESILLVGYEVKELWRYTVIQELIRLVKLRMQEFSFMYSEERDNDKYFDFFNKIGRDYTPSQIYSLIWFGVRKIDNLRTTNQWGNYKYHQAEFLIKIIEETIQKKIITESKIESYFYPYDIEPTLFTKVVFEQLIDNKAWFETKMPDIEHMFRMKIPFYEKLLKREEDICHDSDLEYAKFYYLTKFGVVINDGKVSELFTDEKTLYKMSQFLTSDLFGLKTPYYINKVYSTTCLFTLIQKLINSEIEYRLPEEDKKFVEFVESELLP